MAMSAGLTHDSSSVVRRQNASSTSGKGMGSSIGVFGDFE
eukprot:CAMPEP_0197652802 /NCGR_PEP_ID=MMETSP1338-20131121/34669_1 /TAXON_ID=43686 ORGANISM="Pelagodinium beii, Strain RCC1491" /NCGR_SAMPLE_ID=MMETSP1338 /ASSEMBLY_ACC=CAM_ASM_000754 /LENGTH=39 /DNA_ID= /DNA_START= /DNA_END= /DNA_ORIENTATION=